MNRSNTYQAVRIGDIGDWKLICVVSAAGMGAWLRNVDPTQEVVTLFDEKWDDSPESLLSRIENCVYDHPQVLDDFSADIAVVAPKTVWVPSELVTDDSDEAAMLYRQVYNALPEDVMTEQVEDATALFTLVPGLNAFLQRTFPGARVHSHMGVLCRRFRERAADMPRLYVDIRDGEADFIAFDMKNLLMSATHTWHDPADIQYHLFNIMNVFGLDPAATQVSLSGDGTLKTALMQELRKTLKYVMLTMMPGIGARSGMPLCGSLLLR